MTHSHGFDYLYYREKSRADQAEKHLAEARARAEDAEKRLREAYDGMVESHQQTWMWISRADALFGEVQALKKEAQTCPSLSHHVLVTVGDDGRLVMEDIYDEIFSKTAAEGNLPGEMVADHLSKPETKRH